MSPSRRPRIAVLMDENTSSGGTRYEAGKGYFQAVLDAGGAPYGLPYALPLTAEAVRDFDGLVTCGGRFAYPDDWYVAGGRSAAPASPRFGVERALMSSFLEAGKPVLGICAGMQTLAGLTGCRLTPDLAAFRRSDVRHDDPGTLHEVAIAENTLLRRLLGVTSLTVNSFHREAVAELGGPVRASAHAEDGIVEAIERTDHPFAVGLQWHQELFAGSSHPGARVFAGFVAAAKGA